jgi:dolichyl-phosphate beta-glucosyltransferase
MAVKRRLSIIIPAYNEEKRLPHTLEIIQAWGGECPFELEVIVVDDGSQDRTIDVVRAFQSKIPYLKLVQETHVGYMNAIISGLKKASSPLMASLEADCPVHPKTFELFTQDLDRYDIVMGSRILTDLQSSMEGKSLFRRFISWVSSNLFFFMFNCRIRDAQIGFKLYKKEVLDRVLPKLSLGHDGLKAAEIIVKAHAFGYRIKEVPVVYKHDEDSRCVPKGNYRVIVEAAWALIVLWARSYAEYRRGIIPQVPVRFSFLLWPFWRWIEVSEPMPQASSARSI